MQRNHIRPYSVQQFFDDIDQEFKFLIDEYGFDESSSTWTGHREFGFREHVASSQPRVTFQAALRRVSIQHTPHGAVEVLVSRLFPEDQSASVEQLAREAGAPKPERYSSAYDMAQMTAGDHLSKLAVGLRKYGVEWLSEPSAP